MTVRLEEAKPSRQYWKPECGLRQQLNWFWPPSKVIKVECMAHKVWFQPTKGLSILNWFRRFIQKVRWWSMLSFICWQTFETSTRQAPADFSAACTEACWVCWWRHWRKQWRLRAFGMPLGWNQRPLGEHHTDSPTGGCLMMEFCGDPTANS